MKIEIFSKDRLKPRIAILIISLFFKILGSVFSAFALAAVNPALGIASTIVCLFWFFLLFLAAMPSTDKTYARHIRWLGRLAKISIISLISAGIIEIVLFISIDLGVFQGTKGELANLLDSFTRIGAYSDAAALEHQAINNFLDGKNPYKEANIITAGKEFDVPSTKLTPLRKGLFANAFPYPDLGEIEELYVNAQANPDKVPVEFETKYNYPAASFILLIPFIALGIDDLRTIFLLCLMPALAFVIWKAGHYKLRLCFILVLVASLELWNSLFSGGTSLLVLPFLLIAWLLYRKNLWLSALFLGIALATKQTAWFILPFFLILVLRESGLLKAVYAAAIAGGVFMAFNLPYIIAGAGLWFNSVMAPMMDDVFTSNIWIITLNYIGLIDIQSPLPFTVLELFAFLIAMIWYYFYSPRYPATALVLSVFPLFFAWRGSWGYFFYIDIIMLATILLPQYWEKNTAVLTELK